jgi:hypothetical protein
MRLAGGGIALVAVLTFFNVALTRCEARHASPPPYSRDRRRISVVAEPYRLTMRRALICGAPGVNSLANFGASHGPSGDQQVLESL